MLDLRTQLQDCFRRGACLMGLGNVDYGDDGFGVRLAEDLANADVPGVVVAGTTPHRSLGRALERCPAHLIFADALEFGGVPGAAVFFDAAMITAKLPQVSTHKISLGLLAKYAEADGKTKAWLLGVQPESLKPGQGLTPTVQVTLEILREIIASSLKTL